MTSKLFVLTKMEGVERNGLNPVWRVWRWEIRRVFANPLNWAFSHGTIMERLDDRLGVNRDPTHCLDLWSWVQPGHALAAEDKDDHVRNFDCLDFVLHGGLWAAI
jgi:hypothetical protein